MRTFEDIPAKHRTHLAGSYNPGVYNCRDCGYNPIQENESHFDNAIGFARSNMGIMAIFECPKCFEKWYCHARLRRHDDDRDTYDYFLQSIQDGTNKHHQI